MRGIIAKHRGIIALSSDMARSWDCIFHAWQCARPPTNLIIVLSCYSGQVHALIGSQGSVFACERGGASLLYTGASLLVHGGALMPLWSSIDAPSVSAPESFPASPRWVALPKVMPRPVALGRASCVHGMHVWKIIRPGLSRELRPSGHSQDQ